jgi:16S rRNA (cytosine1402-N4)-methyltransferase
MKFEHTPVLLNEVIEYLEPQPNQNFIDCTVGGGGHAKAILQRTGPNGKLLGIDLDAQAIKAAKQNLQEFKDRIVLINDNYQNLKQIIYDTGFNKINGILLDLGVSSYQIQSKTRGFSFKEDSFLDMRFGDTKQTATDIINNYKEADLIRIFKEYGEERYAKQIAREIVDLRQKQPITQANQLVNIIERVYQNKPKPKKIHVATKVFQALRIEVNNELANLKKILPQALEVLAENGRLVVISFHSLEDKIVKEFFKKQAKDCLCPPQIPVCVCEHKAQLQILTKKVIKPSQTEIMKNPRSRSAKLRAAVKI